MSQQKEQRTEEKRWEGERRKEERRGGENMRMVRHVGDD